MKSRLLLITSSLLGVVATRVVFQGTCDEPQPLCEHRCVAESPETYECLCREGHRLLDDGLSCVKEKEAETTATATSPVLSEALRFSPSTSFARFPSPESAYLETNLSIVFRFTELNDGLLLFGGAADGDDYLSLAVIGPNIMLRFDCGEGAIEDLYRGPFPENQWHTLNVSRKFCSRTEIQVDDKLKLIDKLDEFKFYKGISMDENVYVGGAPLTIRELERKAGTTRNFQGCVRRVSVNEAVLFDADLRLNTAVNEAELGKPSPSKEVVV